MTAGKKHVLVMYRHVLGRFWPWTFVLGLLLLGMWYLGPAFTSLYRPELSGMILGAGGYTLFFGLFALFSRRMGYVRAYDRFLLVATPFFRFRTSYERLRGIRSVDFHRLFNLEGLGWTEMKFVEPMIGKTAIVVRLSGYPLSTALLSRFFPRYLFSPQDTEFVFVVPDWMKFSGELDSRYNKYRESRQMRKQGRGFQRGMTDR